MINSLLESEIFSLNDEMFGNELIPNTKLSDLKLNVNLSSGHRKLC